MGEGIGYPPPLYPIPTSPRLVKKEEKNLKSHLKHIPQNNDSDNAHKCMPEEEVPILEKLKINELINEGPYCHRVQMCLQRTSIRLGCHGGNQQASTPSQNREGLVLPNGDKEDMPQ